MFDQLGDALSDLTIVIGLPIDHKVGFTVYRFLEAFIRRPGDGQIILVSPSIHFIAVNRWITSCPEVSCSRVAVVSLMRRYYLFIRFTLCLRIVFSFRRFRRMRITLAWQSSRFAWRFLSAVWRTSYSVVLRFMSPADFASFR